MRRILIKKLKDNIFGLLYGVIVFIFFFLIFKLRIPTDIQAHIEILKIFLNNGSFPNPPLYYLCVYALSLFIPNNPFVVSSLLVLVIISIVKYLVVANYFERKTSERNFLLVSGIAFTLMFTSPIFLFYFDGDFLYLGKFTSSIWHNSTTIFVFPFCIWLYIVSLRYLENPSNKALIQLFGITILIQLAKPSFLFSFVIVFPLASFYKFGWLKKWSWSAVVVCILIFASLILQKYLIYQQDSLLDKLVYGGKSSNIIIAPFQVWLSYAKNPLWALLSSFVFLLSYIVLNFRRFIHDLELLYCFLLLAISLVIFFILAESGPRFLHANFYWQIPIAILIMNMTVLSKIIFPYINKSESRFSFKKLFFKDKVVLSFYLLHFISGIYYVGNILLNKSYT